MAEKRPIWTKSFINISISTFFIFVVFYALLTFMPLYVLNDLGGTVTEGGVAVSIFLLSAIIMRFFAGMILEKFGKKKILMIALFLFAVSTAFYVFVGSFTVLLLLRFFQGIWFSLVTTVAGAIAADIIPPERRGEGLGYYGIAMNLAVIVGPFIALTLQQYISARIIFIVLAGIMIIGFFCALAVKVEKEPVSKNDKHKMTINDFLEKKSIPIATVGFFISFAYASILTFISVYTESLGLIKAASFFFVVYAIAMLLVRPITGRLFDTIGPSVVIIPSIIIFGAGLISLSFADSSWMLLASGGLVGLGYGTLLPSFQTIAIRAADKHRSGYATGTFFALYDSGIAVGSVSLGIIAGIVGYSNLYLMLGIFVILIVFYYMWMMSKKHASSH
ncbi:major facilitator family transporter [Planococcus antarcticus DSM 14505]|uniref:MFS transporter n=1 Tax=Planococcus antarcticus DSM 14505 TaxID=1185653 RepID=A0A1C7DBX9_9BACL|nr:MFS transporter [Planococcus antarcticus]ANU09010.1 MFS transporter [Planococcus antarcticus DSM 14505]EIM07260.1 major facilitator family transporter [Planococcus antarcticus DSM 14505]